MSGRWIDGDYFVDTPHGPKLADFYDRGEEPKPRRPDQDIRGWKMGPEDDPSSACVSCEHYNHWDEYCVLHNKVIESPEDYDCDDFVEWEES